MPLYTFVMTYKGSTKVSQHRRSNYRGFLLEPIGAAFPELKAQFGDLMRMAPEAVPNTERTWRAAIAVLGEQFTLHVIETKG